MQVPQPRGDAGKLRVDHARGGFLLPGGSPGELPEAVAYEVAHPALQIVQAGSHAFEAGRLALGCGGGIGGLALVFLLLLLTRGAFFACVKPFLYPIGRFALRKGGLLLDAEQEQGQGMLAGKFSARAGALEDRPGQVGFDLVGFGSAAFAFAPYGVFVEAERRPLAGFEQSLRRLDGGGVRGEGQYRFGGEFHRLSCCRRPCGRFLKDRKKGDGGTGPAEPLCPYAAGPVPGQGRQVRRSCGNTPRC